MRGFMKIKIILYIFFCMLPVCAVSMALPVATVENPVYTFDAVPEGANVEHEFVIKNSGDMILTIDNVMPP